jgi:VCBS repeat-containing protein
MIAIESTLDVIGVTAVEANSVFAGIDGSGVATVIIDTGIDLNHPFFGADLDADGVADRIIFQYDFANDDTDASDASGHGSHVASLIASEDSTYRGVAMGADLIVLKVFEDSGEGYFSYLEEALQWVIANKELYNIGVINLSLGDGGNWTESFSLYGVGDELAALAGSDIITVAAAGNNYYQYQRTGIAYPAADPAVLAVGATWAANFGGPWRISNGATDYSTDVDRIAAFSQRDAELVDTFSPGARFNGASATGGIRTMQGTSQAAAIVSGVAALAQQIAHRELGRGLTTAEFALLLEETNAVIVDGDDEVDNVTNTGFEYGRIDFAALAERILTLGQTPAGEGQSSNGGDGSGGLVQQGESGVYDVNLSGGDAITGLDFFNQLETGNQAPVAVNDTYTTDEDIALTVDAVAGVLANDTDPEQDSMTVSLAIGPAHGSLTLNADGSFTYTPNADHNGTDSFTYTVSDSEGNTDEGTAAITVNPVNDAPVANDDAYTISEDTTISTLRLQAAEYSAPYATDYNGDGLFDLLIGEKAGTDTGKVRVYVNEGTEAAPVFNSFSYVQANGADLTVAATGCLGASPNTVDWNNDGHEDLILGLADGSVQVYLNNGDGTGFGAGAYAQAGSSEAKTDLDVGDRATVEVADLNNDGLFDLVLGALDGKVHVYLNDGSIGSPDFTSENLLQDGASDLMVPGGRSSVVFADLNNDGLEDLLTGNTDGQLLLYANRGSEGSPIFTGYEFLSADGIEIDLDGTPRSRPTVIDYNNDEVPDILLGAADGFVRLYFGQSNQEGQILTFTSVAPSILNNDADVEGDSLTAVLVSDASHGTVALNADGSFSYTPTPNYSGSDSFTYRANDGAADSNVATVTFTIDPVNDDPVANPESVETDEGTAITIAAAELLGNDTDVDGDTLSIIGVSNAMNGTVELNGGDPIFTPTLDFNGAASFDYTVSDGNGGTSTTTVDVTVTAVNDSPVANPDGVETAEDTAITIAAADLLGNDADVDGDTLSIIGVGNAVNGTVELNGDGDPIFTPTADFNGAASFDYTVSDGNGGTATATVAVTVTAVNDSPVANPESVETDEDAAITITAADLLGNDTDVDGDSLSIFEVGNAVNGTVELNAGDPIFTPTADFNGAASFDYTVLDGNGGTSTTTVAVTVNAVNDAPVANPESVETDEDTAITISASDLLGNDTDVDGNALSVLGVGNAVNGTVELNGDDPIFTPTLDFNGAASFDYTVSDGNGGISTTTVAVTVAAVNDAPVANPDSVETDEDTAITISASDLIGNDADVDGDTLSIIGVGNAVNGTVELNGGDPIFTPTLDFNGAASFDYTLSDGNGGTATATVAVTVNAVNDDPVANPDSVTTDEDTAITIAAADLLDNDTDVDGNALSIIGVGNAVNGTVELNGEANPVFTPTAFFNGAASFDYTISDGNGGTATATVAVTVIAVNANYVNIPTNLGATPGSTITVPINLSEANGLETADIRLAYDSELLSFVAVRQGSVTSGALLIFNATTPGSLRISLSLTVPRPLGGGSLVEIDFQIKPSAIPGTSTPLNLQSVSLNEGELVLSPNPKTGADSTDGLITVLPSNTAPVADIDGDSQTVAEGSLVEFIGTAVDPDDGPENLTLTWDFGDGATATGTLNPSHTYSDNGIYTVTFTVMDEEGATGSDTQTVTVENVAPAVSVSSTAQEVQYSDTIPASVTFTATDAGAADTMNAAVSYSYNGAAFLAGLPDAATIGGQVSLIGADGQASPATWTLGGIADLAPGTYVFQLAITDGDGGVGTGSTTLTVSEENAQTSYVGPSFVCTPSVLGSTATVELRAVIRDITAVDGTDGEAGDITTATVTFINRDTGAIIAEDVAVGLINPADPKTGAAVFNWQVDRGGADSASFNVGILVNGHYTAAEEDIVVTVSKPFNDYFTGNGFLVNRHSAGIYSGDAGKGTSFKAKVRFNATLTSLTGEFTAVICHEGRSYQIKTSSMDSLVGDPISNTATFVAKASLIDITNPTKPVSIAGNLSLIVTLNDASRTGAYDLVGLTLWKGSELWFSSNWSGSATAEQALSGGSIVAVAQARPLRAEAVVSEASKPGLSSEQLAPIVQAAISRWASIADAASLGSMQFRIAELEGSTLGLARGNTVWLDVDGAGNGWFIDPTPDDDSEFQRGSGPSGVDLLSAVMHEMGHALGYEDVPATSRHDELMTGVLGTGERYWPKTIGETSAAQNLVSLAREKGVDSSRHTKMKPNRDWVVNFLINGGKNPDPNSRIRIDL